MPTVPMPQRQVGVAPLPDVRVAPSAPAAAFPGALNTRPDLGGVRQVVDRLHQEAVDRANQVAGVELDNQLFQQASQIEAQALQRRGKDAAGALDATRTAWQAAVAPIVAGGATEAQRLFAAQRAASYAQRVQSTVERHVTSELERYDADTTQAAVANRLNAAVAGYDDPVAVGGAVAETRAIINDRAKRLGLSDDAREQAVNAALSQIHVGVLGRMLDTQQDRTAQTYFDANKDQIDGTERGKIERALHAGSTLGEATRRADAIFAARDVTASSALAAAEAIDDPTIRRATIQQVTAHFARVNTAERLDREDARARVMRDLEANGGRLNRGSLDWQRIDGYAEGEQVLARQQQLLHPPPDPGDPDKYARYLAMAAVSPESRRQFLALSMADIANDPTLNAGQKAAIIDRWRGERQRDVSDLQRQVADGARDIKDMQRTLEKGVALDGSPLSDEGVEALRARMLDAMGQQSFLEYQLKQARAGEVPAVATHLNESVREPAPTGSQSPFGLSPAKPVTPEMQQDLATYGEGYATYLRNLGYDVPALLPKKSVPKP